MSTPAGILSARRRRRTVDAAPLSAGSPDVRHLWFSGVLAALQALGLSLAVVVLPSVAAYLASSAGADSGFGGAVSVGAGLWLLAHGVPLAAGGTAVSLVPVGLSLLALFSCYAAARRSAQTSVSAWAAGVVTYAVLCLIIALLVGSAPGWSELVGFLGGGVLAALGLGAGILARADAPRIADLTWRLDRVVPPVARLGARAGLLGTALLVGVAGLLALLWIIAGRSTSADIVAGLAPGAVGGVVLAVAQLTLLPNFVLWSTAWLVGPGFAVGDGSHFATSGTQSGPLPAVPLLGALPGAGWSNVLAPWLPALVVALGVVAGIFLWRRVDGVLTSWRDLALAVGTAGVVAGLLVGALQALAGGAVGPGRLAEVGAPALLTGLLVAAEIGGGVALAVLWCRFEVGERLRQLADRSANRVPEANGDFEG